MHNDVEFRPWPKTNRLKSMHVTVTYKVDGTNAAVHIRDGKLVGCQSRNRLLKPGDDNMGFAFWANENAEVLGRLGDGVHYGEWAGPGIQKNPHKLDRKSFYLFDTRRHAQLETDDAFWVAGIYAVPVLYEGDYDEDAINEIMREYSGIDSGFEGVIIYFHDFRTHMKRTVRCPEGKWKEAA